ncbi:MAG: glutamine--tRNA ligase/YqeY domain fusion protein [Clostridia bacterium]|nr:glutamine--tRNA ligase/YqeY domain fusion protein [Clostridia bacterium]
MSNEINTAPKESVNFIERFVKEDIENGVCDRIQTRFPPEPNGYLHIGHAKALCIDFGMAEQFGGKCNLRFDDTNPTKEDAEFVDAIREDIHWLGFDYDKLAYGSDYFDTCYELAVKLIRKGVAYVCDLSKDEMREFRGTLTEPGKESPYRNRSVEENLDLFERMRKGEFEDGSRTLRAKIDMASPNLNMRDPTLYRIIHMSHHHTGDSWCIYPMYDFAHPIQDAIEGITHSLCTIEYEAHRPLYNWVVDQCEFEHKPRQIEFAPLNIAGTILSKRFLRRLVEEGYVSGWDDPRMPTLCGMRRRGYTPGAIRDFLSRVGVAKTDSEIDPAMLEHCLREELNLDAPRIMVVTKPLEVVVDNYPEDTTEKLSLELNPNRPEQGSCEVTFGKTIYIEEDDFCLEPPKGYFRLAPGIEVRLKGAYFVKYVSHETDENGNVVRVHVTYDPESRGGNSPDGRKVKGTIHWAAACSSVDAELRMYDNLFRPVSEQTESSDGSENAAPDFTDHINPESLTVLKGAKVDTAFASSKPLEKFQFMRQGYFCTDRDSTPGYPIFNRSVSLKDSWGRKK